MLKKILLIIFIASYIYADESSMDYSLTFHEGLKVSKTGDLFVYEADYLKENKQQFKFSVVDIKYDSSGYGFIEINDGKNLIIHGAKFFISDKKTKQGGLKYSTPLLLSNPKLLGYETVFNYIKPDGTVQFDSGISYDERISLDKKGILDVRSSSYFEENTSKGKIVYDTTGLNKRNLTVQYLNYWFAYAPPWVEGVDGSGVGEWLEIIYEKPKNNIVILNGYVDLKKLNLYKDNNRVKKFRVSSLDSGEPFDFEIELEDKVKFQYFKLPRNAEKIRLEILEVYKGRKWDDTCVTGLFSTNN